MKRIAFALSILSLLLVNNSKQAVTINQVQTPVPSVPPISLDTLEPITASNADKIQSLATLSEPQEWVFGVAYNSSRHIISASDETGDIFLWDSHQPILIAQLKINGSSSLGSNIIFSQDGNYLISTRNSDSLAIHSSIIVWSVDNILQNKDNAKPMRILTGHQAPIRNIALNNAGNLLVSRDDNGFVRLWKMPSGELLQELNTGCQGPGEIDLQANGSLLAVTGFCEKVELWDTKTYRLINTILGDSIGNVAKFSPDGKLFAFEKGTSKGTSIHILESQHFYEIAVLSSQSDPYCGDTASLAFSPDGQLMAAGCVYEGLIIWDIGSGRNLVDLDTGAVSDIAFSDDSKFMVTGHQWSSPQGFVALWGILPTSYKFKSIQIF